MVVVLTRVTTEGVEAMIVMLTQVIAKETSEFV